MHYVGYRHTPVATLPCRFPPKLMPQLQATRNEHRVDGSLLKLHSHLISVRPGSPGVVLQMPLRRCEHVGVSLGPTAAPNYNCSQSKPFVKEAVSSLNRLSIKFQRPGSIMRHYRGTTGWVKNAILRRSPHRSSTVTQGITIFG